MFIYKKHIREAEPLTPEQAEVLSIVLHDLEVVLTARVQAALRSPDGQLSITPIEAWREGVSRRRPR
ncbi:hypothetical protein [Rhizobium tumorigenes]|uniref:Uncharacterized protein n=1 Tax=Rhizobium tumorigenes TaxID=2041385 RepID=A0AAF1KJY4_9HYPH|nr:hypothetical protein [Rhizobium tumorigenes]WFR97596.1 hypothetical protein PR017_20550 [Rhizobium tumorigenes]WFS03198.1 hypothetical protein PR016_21295 [Rhizobium tumorigenes]